MFERFTDRARRIVVLAQEEARLLHSRDIGVGHILLALMVDDDIIAAKVLNELGYSHSKLKETLTPPGPVPSTPSGHIPFTAEAKTVLEKSLREALQLGHNYIGTDHILLGIVRVAQDEDTASRILLGKDAPTIRHRTVRAIAERHGQAEQEGLPPAAKAGVERNDKPLNDYQAMHEIVGILDQLPRERRKAVIAYVRQYAKRTG